MTDHDTFQQFLASLPRRSRAVLFLAIFCFFATFGFLTDVMNSGRHSAAHVAFDVAFSGLMAVLITFATIRHRRALWPLLTAQIVVASIIAAIAPRIFGDAPPEPTGSLTLRLILDSTGTMIAVICGYIAIAVLLTWEGARYLRMRAEMVLAQEIHRSLVPVLAGRIRGFEFAGASHPSGEVGGDLVDVVTRPDGHGTAYVADVSGHGVHAGVVMGMVKSAARMALRRESSLESLLEDLNETLVPLMSPAMFVTAAVIDAGAYGVRYCVAGHLPILRVRRDGTVDEITVANLPLGFFANRTYTAGSLDCAPGDTLALITDGFVEVFDRADRELGLDAIKHVLARTATAPLSDMIDALRAASSRHGAQLDDQSALLLRALPAPDGA